MENRLFNGIIQDGRVYEIVPHTEHRYICDCCDLRHTCGPDSDTQRMCLALEVFDRNRMFRFSTELTDKLNK